MPDLEVEVLPLRRRNCHPEKAVLVLADGMNRHMNDYQDRIRKGTQVGGVFFFTFARDQSPSALLPFCPERPHWGLNATLLARHERPHQASRQNSHPVRLIEVVGCRWLRGEDQNLEREVKIG